MTTQTVTVTWVDPVVGPGQAALATLTVYAALVTTSVGPLFPFGTAAPGAQTFSGPATPTLATGSRYVFTVKATDANGLEGLQGNNSATLGPIGAPGAPTIVKAVLS